MLPALPELPRRWGLEITGVIVIAIIARLLVLFMFHLRGLSFPYVDAAGYTAQAEWLIHQGTLDIPEGAGARFFHGVPLLLALVGRLTGHLAVTGVVLNMAMAAGACALFYRNFPRFDWSAWHALLLPSWLAMSSTLHSEGALWFFSLIGLTALRLPVTDRRRSALLLVAGFAFVCRPTAFFVVLPAFVVAWGALATLRPRFWIEAALLGFFAVWMAAWSWMETGTVFIQSRWQASEFIWWSKHWGGSFPESVFSWPAQSLLSSFLSSHVRFSVKLVNLAHFLIFVGACALALRAWLHDRTDVIARWLTLGLAINGLFVLTIGGPFGGTIFYRFISTQANIFILLAWFRHTRLPTSAWWAACALSIALAGQIARAA